MSTVDEILVMRLEAISRITEAMAAMDEINKILVDMLFVVTLDHEQDYYVWRDVAFMYVSA